MQTKKVTLLIVIILGLWACKDTNSSESDETNQLYQDSIDQANTDPVEATRIYTWVDRLRMRELPDTKSGVIKELSAGDPLIYLKEKSDFTQKITLRGVAFDEPWLKVKTSDGKIGWVYGGGVKFYAPKVDQSPTPYDKCYDFLKAGRDDRFESCFLAEQMKQMNKNDKMVNKEEGMLKLRLLSGNYKILNDNTSSEGEYKVYDYFYYYPKMSSYVVRVKKMDGYQFILINDKSGRERTIWGFPKIAPSGQHMIVTNADEPGGKTKNGIQVLGFTDSGLKVIWEEEMEAYRPYTAKWFDSETAEVSLRSMAGLPDSKSKVAKVRLVDGKWRMEI
mgnify:CR=1 FL=1